MRCPERYSRPASLALILVAASSVFTDTALSAYISEIDQSGPAGRGIELSDINSTSAYTLVFMDANPYTSLSFGTVVDVMHLSAGAGLGGVAMVTEKAWPADPALTVALSSATVSLASGASTLNLSLNRLLVVMPGNIDIRRFDNPMSDSAALTRYKAGAVADWLVMGSGPLASLYQTNGYDLSAINSKLGIDLLTRLVDKDAGRVIGRSHMLGQAIDMDQFFLGDPDTSMQFEIQPHLKYTYTPGISNLPLLVTSPEPGSAVALSTGLALLLRRRRA